MSKKTNKRLRALLHQIFTGRRSEYPCCHLQERGKNKGKCPMMPLQEEENKLTIGYENCDSELCPIVEEVFIAFEQASFEEFGEE